MWAFLVVISLLVFAGSLVGLLFKGTRGKAKRYAWMSALAMFFAVGFFASEQDDEARRMGFVDNDDRRATTEAGATDAATWRAAKEAKKQEQQDSSLQEANAVRSGRAKICATRDVEFDSFREIRLPAKTVFQDLGPLTGAARDPWKPGGASDSRRAGFLTADPVTLTKAAPCAESGVRMLVGGLFMEPVARVADRRVWQIEDVLDYSPTPAPPPVEFGKLIDDMSVQAELLSDAGDPLILPKQKADEKDEAAKCLTEAQKMAAHEGGVVGRQTGSVVFVSHPAASEFSFGCGVDGIKPDVFVAWNKARPRPSTVKLISSAGAFLTGAPIEDIKRELNRCIGDALKPDAGDECGVLRRRLGAEHQAGREILRYVRRYAGWYEKGNSGGNSRRGMCDGEEKLRRRSEKLAGLPKRSSPDAEAVVNAGGRFVRPSCSSISITTTNDVVGCRVRNFVPLTTSLNVSRKSLPMGAKDHARQSV